jgi:regulator of replication initiation timing
MTPRLTPEQTEEAMVWAKENAQAIVGHGTIIVSSNRTLAISQALLDAKEELDEWKALDQERNLHTQSLMKENQRLRAEFESTNVRMQATKDAFSEQSERCDLLYNENSGLRSRVSTLLLDKGALISECEELREALGSFVKLYVAAEDGEMLQDCCKNLSTTLMHGDLIFRVNYTEARFVDQVLLKSQGSRVRKLVSALENSCDCVRGLVCPACEALKEWNS